MKIFLNRNVKVPSIGTSNSVGIDFYVPQMDPEFLNDFRKINDVNNYILVLSPDIMSIKINPHSIIKIPSGVHVRLPQNTALLLHDKSGISTKNGLTKVAGVIDEDFEDEVVICLLNYTNEIQVIEEGIKIIQGILINKLQLSIECETSLEDLYKDFNSDRVGGFGSTGKF